MRLAGSWRAATRKGEPVLPIIVPQPPEWLEPPAREAWDELVRAIGPMRVLTDADAIGLGHLAEYLSRWKHATKQLARYGDVLPVKDDSGAIIGFKRSPYVAMQLEYGLMVRRMMQEFGLTPSARTRLTQEHDTKQVETIFSRKAALTRK
jgi:P27 family predicted phage terminase small subunit